MQNHLHFGGNMPMKDNFTINKSSNYNVLLICNVTTNRVTPIQLNSLDVTEGPPQCETPPKIVSISE